MGTEKGCTFAPANDASVAQLVEHLTLNQGVQGSTPCGSTSNQQTLTDNQTVRVFSCLLLACFWRDSIKMHPEGAVAIQFPMWKSAAKITCFLILTTIIYVFLRGVSDWLTKAATMKLTQKREN